MKPRRQIRSRRAFLLAEAMFAIAMGVVAVAIGSKLLVDAMYLQYLAAGHDNRLIAQNAVTEHLRADLLSSAAYEWRTDGDAATLLLFESKPSTTAEIEYRIEPEHVVRRTAQGDESVWGAERLAFRGERLPAPNTSLLRIAFVEVPPARATALPNRTLERTFRLPPERAAAPAKPEATP